MTGEQFRTMLDWLRTHPAIKKGIYIVSKSSVLFVYCSYLVLLLLLAVNRDWHHLAQEVAVPALAFVLGTVLRSLINRPRPYEEFDFVPLFPKATKGQSFPSRHCFCGAAIAVCTGILYPVWGIVLGIVTLILAASRVLTGVHRISDVAAGLVFGAAVPGFCALVGFLG